MKLSQKDILILIGIVVAGVIAVTTLFFENSATAEKPLELPAKKTSLQRDVTTILKNIAGQTRL